MSKKHDFDEKTGGVEVDPFAVQSTKNDGWKTDGTKHDGGKADAKVDPNAPLPGSFETEGQKTAREDREKAAAESGGEVRMSPVNPRKPLDKEPVYASGVGPSALDGSANLGAGTIPTDPRVPPENVSTAGVAPGGRAVDGKSVSTSSDPIPGQLTAQPLKAAAPAPIPTPAQVGLAQPELRAGLDPLPEEEPTPSTVPIPPPGPRRVA